ncbi:hypothetical protein [Streptomyces sp. NPDC059781]|uniref:hypothetical protein n=1 Tax=Streptomyces sp. NPDC059781 TaxID=3346943 RepID=UPI00365ED048
MAGPEHPASTGIGVTAGTVSTGMRGAQPAGRASLIGCGVLPARAGGREPFRELIAALEAALDLLWTRLTTR